MSNETFTYSTRHIVYLPNIGPLLLYEGIFNRYGDLAISHKKKTQCLKSVVSQHSKCFLMYIITELDKIV